MTKQAIAANADSPSFWLAASEPVRAASEFGLFGASLAPMLALSARGDGHPVLVLPGLLASDRSTLALRRVLTRLGFDARPWKLGANLGMRTVGRNGEKLQSRLDEIHQESGKKISLLGWSLGGVLARLLATRAPEIVRQVITLGSPFAGDPKSTNAWKTYEWASGTKIDDRESRALLAEIQSPSSVASTAIYSRGDGICAWQTCLDRSPANRRENIEVHGSHCGLGVNPSVIYAVADRLAQPESEWTPFRAKGLARILYPRAA